VTTRQRTNRQPQVHTQLGRAAVQVFAASDRMNQVLIEHLDPAVWRANPPGKNKVRTIAAIFTHMHNVRCKWVRLTVPHLKVTRQLNRAHCTPPQVLAVMENSLLAGDVSKQTHDTISKQLQDPQISRRRMDDPARRPNLGAIAGLILGSPEFQRR